MARHQIIQLGLTATAVSPTGTHSGMDITIQNLSLSDYVYIGGKGVTNESFGYRLLPNHAFSIELAPTDSIFAVADSENVSVAVLQANLESQN